MTAAALPLRAPLVRWRDERAAAAKRLRRTVLAWEGVTVHDGHARLGCHDLGRFPSAVRPARAERLIARFRDRYDAAADAIDRRAGVHEPPTRRRGRLVGVHA